MSDINMAAIFAPMLSINNGECIKMHVKEKGICQVLKQRTEEIKHEHVALYLAFGDDCVRTVDMDGELFKLNDYRLVLLDRSMNDYAILYFSEPLIDGFARLPVINNKPAQRYIYHKIGLIRCDDYDNNYANYRQPDGKHQLYYEAPRDKEAMYKPCTDHIDKCPYSY